MAMDSSQTLKIEDTAKAREALLERGEKITVAAVRKQLGERGSNTTISEHLKKLSSGWGSPSLYLGQFPQRLNALCQDMAEMMEDLAIQRVAHMSALIEDERRDLALQKSALQHERELALTAFEAEQRTNAELRLRLAEATQNHSAAVAELNDLRPRVAKADLLNEQLSERMLEASRKIDKLQLHITNYEDEVKKQLQLDADLHAGQVAALEQGLTTSRTNELRLTENLGEAKRRIDSLTTGQSAAESRAALAERELSKSQALVVELSIEQTNNRKREEDREQRLSAALTDKEAAANKLIRLQEQLIEAQSSVEKLRLKGAAEHKSLISNLVDHSRRVFELASQTVTIGNSDLKELGFAQSEIERLFRNTD